MLMVHASGINKDLLHYADIDIDQNAIKIAKEITDFEQLKSSQTKLLHGNIFDNHTLQAATGGEPIDIVEMMGIFEYLDEERSAELLKLMYGLLKEKGIIIAGNMRQENRHLNLHKRGVGWPDVIPRKVEHLISICQNAGIDTANLSIYQPLDGVYNVLLIRKQ